MPIIQNSDALAENDPRRDALAIAEAGYEAVNVGTALRRTLRLTDDELVIDQHVVSIKNRDLFFVGVGKCAFAAAEAIEELLGDRLTGGIALDVSANERPGRIGKAIETHTGTHPLPSGENARATNRTYAAGRALLVVIFLMLLWNPLYLVFDPGFGLSVVATAGLIWLAPLIELRLAFLKNEFLRSTTATTLSAQIAVLPPSISGYAQTGCINQAKLNPSPQNRLLDHVASCSWRFMNDRSLLSKKGIEQA